MKSEDEKIVFKQRSFYEMRVFQLYEDRINVKELRMSGSSEYTKPFEAIFDERIKIRSYPKGSLIGIVASIVFFLVFAFFLRSNLNVLVGPAVIFGIVIFLFGIHILFSYKRFIGYDTDTKPLLFFEDIPTIESFDNFLEVFEKRKKAYISKKYGDVDIEKNVAAGITQLVWLKERGALTEEEFQLAKKKILGNNPSSLWESTDRFN